MVKEGDPRCRFGVAVERNIGGRREYRLRNALGNASRFTFSIQLSLLFDPSTVIVWKVGSVEVKNHHCRRRCHHRRQGNVLLLIDDRIGCGVHGTTRICM